MDEQYDYCLFLLTQENTVLCAKRGNSYSFRAFSLRMDIGHIDSLKQTTGLFSSNLSDFSAIFLSSI